MFLLIISIISSLQEKVFFSPDRIADLCWYQQWTELSRGSVLTPVSLWCLKRQKGSFSWSCFTPVYLDKSELSAVWCPADSSLWASDMFSFEEEIQLYIFVSDYYVGEWVLFSNQWVDGLCTDSSCPHVEVSLGKILSHRLLLIYLLCVICDIYIM